MNQIQEKLSLWLVLFAVFLDWLGIGLVYPMFSAMLFSPSHLLLDPGVSGETRSFYLGILLAAMSVAQFFSGPLLGALSDQKGRKPLFLISLAAGMVGYGFCMWGILAKNVILLIGARVLVGLAAGNASIVSAVIADLSTPANKAKHFGLYSMMCGVGFTVGPFLGGKLSEGSFATPFLVAGVATLVNLVLIFFFFKETHSVRQAARLRLSEGIRNLKKAWKIPALTSVFLTVLFFCFGWSFFYEFIPVSWIADYRFDAGKIGFFYAYGAGIYALSAGLLIGPIVKRYKSDKIMCIASCALALLILMLLTRPNEGWLWIYLPLVNFLAALVYPTFSTIVSNCASRQAQGETLGILQSIQSAAFALSPLAAGPLLGANPHMPMLVGGLSILLAALVSRRALQKSDC
jgi:DHA1 family tetracycline resistance protein-like MFS transporter